MSTADAEFMRLAISVLMCLTAYLVWATSFAGSAGAAIPGLGH